MKNLYFWHIALIPLYLFPLCAFGETGVIEHLRIDRTKEKTSEIQVRIRSNSSRIFTLPEALRATLAPRTVVEFTPGTLQNSSLTTQSLQDSITIIEEPSEPSESQHRALILKLRFQDGDVACSDNRLNRILIGGKKNVRDWFRESSEDLLQFNFDGNGDGFVDVYTIDISASVSEGCDSDSWADEADTQATAMGIDLTQYEHITYLLPKNTVCDWGGLGTMDCGEDCRVWTRDCSNLSLYLHEYGHNIGLDHASKDEDGDGEADSEYGDTSCPMGSATTKFRHFNGPHQAMLGWIQDEYVVKSDNSEVALYPVEIEDEFIGSPENFPTLDGIGQLLRIPVPGAKVGPVETEHFYASFRRKVGRYSKSLPKQYKDAITIHRRNILSGQAVEVATLNTPDTSYTDPSGATISLLDRDKERVVVWGSSKGIDAPTYHLTTTVTLEGNSPLSASEAEKIHLVVKKRQASTKTTLNLTSNNEFHFEGTFGSYSLKLQFPKDRFKLKGGSKNTKILINQDSQISFTFQRIK
ncbi:MAG: hypothetical protein KDD60_00680 [Bdellovibrionales bacterium]|nr:hypothetical protein [Bdellovibrionales bacterium]